MLRDRSAHLGDVKPTGPAAIFGLRNFVAYMRHGVDFVADVAREYGDIARLKFVGLDGYLLSHPAHIEQVLRRHGADTIKDVPTRVLSRFLGEGLVTSEGETWRSHRKLVSFAFTPRRIASYGDTMIAVAERTLERWRDGAVIDMHAEMSRLTMDVVTKVLFGADIEGHADTVARAMADINHGLARNPEIMFGLPDWFPTPGMRRFTSAVAAIDDILYRIIEEHRQSGPTDDLLSVLIDARDNDEARISFTDGQLRDHCVTLFIAGHETTSLALVHALYFLSQNPAVEARFHDELATVLGDRPLTSDDVKKLPYTECILKEAMRLLPPLWGMGREVVRPFELAGYRMEPGIQLTMCQWVVHRDPRWYPQPERFQPERFAPEQVAKRPRMAYFPFGAGARVCIGNHFAMMEAVLLLAIIGRRARVRMEPGQSRLEFLPSVTIRPKRGGWRMRVSTVPGNN